MKNHSDARPRRSRASLHLLPSGNTEFPVLVERRTADTELIDVLDRVLDKGIVIDAAIRLSLAGLNLVDIDMQIVVASIDTYLRYAKPLAKVRRMSLPKRPVH